MEEADVGGGAAGENEKMTLEAAGRSRVSMGEIRGIFVKLIFYLVSGMQHVLAALVVAEQQSPHFSAVHLAQHLPSLQQAAQSFVGLVVGASPAMRGAVKAAPRRRPATMAANMRRIIRKLLKKKRLGTGYTVETEGGWGKVQWDGVFFDFQEDGNEIELLGRREAFVEVG